MSSFTFEPTALGTPLMQILAYDAIEPGTPASYQACKEIFLYHPLGRKMAEAPVAMAQCQRRTITVKDAPDDTLAEEFDRVWEEMNIDGVIRNVVRTSRVYGLSTTAVLAVINGEVLDPSEPLDFAKIPEFDTLMFNVLDPLNTAGSDTLNQDPNSIEFQRPVVTTVMGKTYHRSRTFVVLNEDPVYLAYTSSGFGYVGRSVYQRALYPLKSFIATMLTDDMVARKAGLLIAKMKSPGSIIDRFMSVAASAKRAMLQQAQTGNVLTIDVEEEIESLNLQNIDGAGGFARTNILKNIATAADMPAMILENETMVSGFGEGTEDSKRIASFIDDERRKMGMIYAWFDRIVMRRAWTPTFYAGIQRDYPELYGDVSYSAAFALWEKGFKGAWPESLKEPASERIKADDTKLKSVIALLEVLLPILDPPNRARLVEWAEDNFNELHELFHQPLEVDSEALRDHFEEQDAKADLMAQAGPGEEGDEQGAEPQAPKPFAAAA